MSENLFNRIENSSVYRHGRRGILSMLFSRSFVVLAALLLQIGLLFVLLSPVFERVCVLMGGVAVLTTVMLIYILNTPANPSI